ncbi:1,4-alpha-glucan branching enzyme II [Volvox carteri f. nagariensis]|uniref:1,4-alpha-glucan branching enzyme n=1 Tax=Volvox carteri f. nagariensis TaxID=3068 RepID=D8U9K6_VOLCA|nr:1,4-alpha-glucan branching enzyme II [Volvox carteri f. nagariensis]EFJ43598.1 1,4-alpha-glucan branching enzyme II [Volvox carteri f. nagariensis]|eukprot:XP_002955298.1 1,4-alpha-glucan branching enzyme II [Volvox carteri f. nagariensis]
MWLSATQRCTGYPRRCLALDHHHNHHDILPGSAGRPSVRFANRKPFHPAFQRATSPIFATTAAAVDGIAKEKDEEGLAVVAVDPQLANYADHFRYRWAQYRNTLERIEAAEGSLEQFARGYEYFGFHREQPQEGGGAGAGAGGALMYREWAPAAQAAALVGDFSSWQPVWMTRDQWGVWSVRLPDVDGRPAIPHGSRVKVRLQHPGGGWVDRIPAWIRWAVAEKRMGAGYDGMYWSPPAGERYEFRHPRPPRPPALRIYEAHVGMSSEEPKVASYTEFKDTVLPRIQALGYNAIQLMAVQEHAYYGSFGYHVTNPFAVSSRSGTPEELKALIDEAHRRGLLVLLDVVHSHISKNQEDGLAGFDLGQKEEDNYFKQGEAGYHKLWDSRCLNYANFETLRYLLSNLSWWIEEYHFDGFRFDGVTSMLYHHHGIYTSFSGSYHDYLGPGTNVEAVVYLMLANQLVHQLLPQAVTVAEDVSGMPALCRPVAEGGVGFDARLNMSIPDKWIQLLKHTRDEDWRMHDIVTALCNRRYTESSIGYAESHDQALVGDQTVAFRLMGAEMYGGMSALTEPSEVVARGVALHKMIRLVTLALGGEGWLNFMGNEFGHPEWIDFPRDGNGWSHHYCRRQWSLADTSHLRYKFLQAWDAAMMRLDEHYGILSSRHQWVTHMDERQQARRVLVFERGPLVFVFNWSPFSSFEGYRVAVPCPGKWRVALDSDAWDFGGEGRVGHDMDHFSDPEPAGTSRDRQHSIRVLAPSRTAVVYYNADTHTHWQQPQQQEDRQEEGEEGQGGNSGQRLLLGLTPPATQTAGGLSLGSGDEQSGLL